MSTLARWLRRAADCSPFLLVGGVALMHSGIVRLDAFRPVPRVPGRTRVLGFSSSDRERGRWLGRAHGDRGRSVLVAAVGSEGLICIAMALPLALPLGALGGWLVYRFEPSRLSTRTHHDVVVAAARQPHVGRHRLRRRYSRCVARSKLRRLRNRSGNTWSPFRSCPSRRSGTFEPGWRIRSGPALRDPASGRPVIASSPPARLSSRSKSGTSRACCDSASRRIRRQCTSGVPTAQVLPKHLHGYLISKQGQFRLTRLANNHTLLEGTTWYQHGLWPAEYWRWWSDAIIHRIHLRVLTHIRTLAEKDASAGAYAAHGNNVWPAAARELVARRRENSHYYAGP